MSKQPKFRVRRGSKQNDVKDLQKLNASVRAKVRYHEKKYGVELDIQTKRMSDFSTRAEYNDYKDMMSGFVKSNKHATVTNAQGATIDFKEYADIQKQVQKVNRKKDKDYAKLKDRVFTDRGKETTLTVEGRRHGLRDTRYQTFNHIKFNFDNFPNTKEIARYKERLFRVYEGDFMHKKKLQYRENYIKALRHLNGDADHIIDHVRKMDLDELLDLFYTEKVADIRFPYEKQERERIVYELERVYQVRKGK